MGGLFHIPHPRTDVQATEGVGKIGGDGLRRVVLAARGRPDHPLVAVEHIQLLGEAGGIVPGVGEGGLGTPQHQLRALLHVELRPVADSALYHPRRRKRQHRQPHDQGEDQPRHSCHNPIQPRKAACDSNSSFPPGFPQP